MIPRSASTYFGLTRAFFDDPAYEALVEQDLTTGRHTNPQQRPGWFTTAYYHHPDEIRHELAAVGLTPHALLAIEGPGTITPDIDTWLNDPTRRETLLRAIRRVEAEPTTVGTSTHLLAVAHKPT